MSRKALIVVDHINDFVHEDGALTAGKPAQDITSFICAKVKEFLQNGDVVVCAYDNHVPNDREFENWPVHAVQGTWGQEFYGELKELIDASKQMDNLYLMPKKFYNAFDGTPLEKILAENGVSEVHIMGVATSICVMLTTYGAYTRFYPTVVYQEGMADFMKASEQAMLDEYFKTVFHTQIR
jgi:nicotinamidase-related amidase